MTAESLPTPRDPIARTHCHVAAELAMHKRRVEVEVQQLPSCRRFPPTATTGGRGVDLQRAAEKQPRAAAMTTDDGGTSEASGLRRRSLGIEQPPCLTNLAYPPSLHHHS